MMQQVTHETAAHAFVKAVHGVRYQVTDVARPAAFYTRYLGFTLSIGGHRMGQVLLDLACRPSDFPLASVDSRSTPLRDIEASVH